VPQYQPAQSIPHKWKQMGGQSARAVM